MNPSAARFDATLRAELGSRWVHHALVASAAGVVIGTAGWLGGVAAALWAPAVVSGSVLATTAVRARFSRVTPRLVVFTAAFASLAVAPLASADIVEGTSGGILLAGVAAIAVFEPRRRALALAGALMSIEAAALWLAIPDWAAAVAFVPMAGAAVVTVVLLASLRVHLAERGEAVMTRDQRYRDLFDRVPVGLYRTGLGGEVLDANQALADLLGAPRGAVIGRPIQPFLVDAEDLARLRQRISDDGTPLVTDLRVRRADGTVIWVRDRTRAVRDDTGSVAWFEGELQDITQQVEHVERLQTLVKSKSDLIAAVSHELRTPLTAVVGYLDLLAAGPIEQTGDLLSVASEQAHEVAAIVDDLLTAARLDNRELLVHAEAVDMVGAVRSAIRSMGNPYVLLRVPLELNAVGDAVRVRQVLRNLIGNAYRYGRPPVSVHAEVSDGTVSIIVADRGDPISPAVAAQMFEPFFTTGVGESQPGAIGLGLAVSRQLARRMGGDLRHDRVGAETRFTLELPAAPGAIRAA